MGLRKSHTRGVLTNIRIRLRETLHFHVQVCESRQSTSEGNNLLSTVCSDPQALLSPQWKWNWHSLYLSCRGPPLSAAAENHETRRALCYIAQVLQHASSVNQGCLPIKYKCFFLLLFPPLKSGNSSLLLRHKHRL